MQMRYAVIAILLALGMFFALLIFLEMGRRFGVRRLDTPGARAGVGVVDGTVYALVALLIGFSFNGAAARFDTRRELVAKQANSAGTAWQRLDMLPPESRPAVQRAFIAYMDALIRSYDIESATDFYREAPAVTQTQNALWAAAVAVCITQEGDKARMLVLPSLNELFGVVEQERVARTLHPPLTIYVLLAVTALASAVFVGYALANKERRNWIYMVGVAATIASAIFVIIELEYPRVGFVRIDRADRNLAELRATMK